MFEDASIRRKYNVDKFFVLPREKSLNRGSCRASFLQGMEDGEVFVTAVGDLL